MFLLQFFSFGLQKKFIQIELCILALHFRCFSFLLPFYFSHHVSILSFIFLTRSLLFGQVLWESLHIISPDVLRCTPPLDIVDIFFSLSSTSTCFLLSNFHSLLLQLVSLSSFFHWTFSYYYRLYVFVSLVIFSFSHIIVLCLSWIVFVSFI